MSSLLNESNLKGIEQNRALDKHLPLLLLANRLYKIEKLSLDEISSLKERLINDILSASSSLSKLDIYSEDDIIKLRYLTCVFIDESLLKNELFINSSWANEPLTIRLFNENLGGNKFFGIMDYWLEKPNKNRDFLEFVYACLVLGYKGKYDSDKDCDEKIKYLCEKLAVKIGESLTPSTIFADKPVIKKRAKKLGFLNFKSLRNASIVIFLASTLFAFLYSHMAINENNIKNNALINSAISSYFGEK